MRLIILRYFGTLKTKKCEKSGNEFVICVTDRSFMLGFKRYCCKQFFFTETGSVSP